MKKLLLLSVFLAPLSSMVMASGPESPRSGAFHFDEYLHAHPPSPCHIPPRPYPPNFRGLATPQNPSCGDVWSQLSLENEQNRPWCLEDPSLRIYADFGTEYSKGWFDIPFLIKCAAGLSTGICVQGTAETNAIWRDKILPRLRQHYRDNDPISEIYSDKPSFEESPYRCLLDQAKRGSASQFLTAQALQLSDRFKKGNLEELERQHIPQSPDNPNDEHSSPRYRHHEEEIDDRYDRYAKGSSDDKRVILDEIKKQRDGMEGFLRGDRYKELSAAQRLDLMVMNEKSISEYEIRNLTHILCEYGNDIPAEYGLLLEKIPIKYVIDNRRLSHSNKTRILIERINDVSEIMKDRNAALTWIIDNLTDKKEILKFLSKYPGCYDRILDKNIIAKLTEDEFKQIIAAYSGDPKANHYFLLMMQNAKDNTRKKRLFNEWISSKTNTLNPRITLLLSKILIEFSDEVTSSLADFRGMSLPEVLDPIFNPRDDKRQCQSLQTVLNLYNQYQKAFSFFSGSNHFRTLVEGEIFLRDQGKDPALVEDYINKKEAELEKIKESTPEAPYWDSHQKYISKDTLFKIDPDLWKEKFWQFLNEGEPKEWNFFQTKKEDSLQN